MKSNPSRGRAKPVRDPKVEDAVVVSTPAMEVPPPNPPMGAEGAPTEDLEPSEVPMPTVENEPSSVYVPQAGCSIVDNFEILMMYMLYITGSQLQFAPGVLRSIELPAARVAQLSPQSQKHMRQVAAGPDQG